MATVTGFTAERMLEIENSTVVDGSVQGDNLILMTRGGTPIDAGNVRGPQGVQGIPGPVSSVNDQTGIAYAPRIFPNVATLLGTWSNAPTGAVAVILDTESMYERRSDGNWILINTVRIFVDVAERNAKWPNPIEGSIAVTTADDTIWYKAAGSGTTGWNPNNGVRTFANEGELQTRWPTPLNGSMAITLDTLKTWIFYSNQWNYYRPWGTSWGMVNNAWLLNSSGQWGNNTALIPGLTLGQQLFPHRNYRIEADLFIYRDGSQATHEKNWITNDVYGGQIITQSFCHIPLGAVYFHIHMGRIWQNPVGGTTPVWHTFQMACSTDSGLSNFIGGDQSTSMWIEDVGPAN